VPSSPPQGKCPFARLLSELTGDSRHEAARVEVVDRSLGEPDVFLELPQRVVATDTQDPAD
jgi:hypothetical protein